MIKKNIIILSVAAAVCSLGVCGSKDLTAQNQEENREEASHSMETSTNVLYVQNLTANAAQNVNIDYAIESYKRIQKFGYELFEQNIHDKNPVLSPVSAYLALSMAACGADGTTKDEFYHVLGNDLMALSDDIMNTLPENGDLLKFSIANSAWIDDEVNVEDAWLGTIKSLMDAEAFWANLSAKETMNSINSWVDDKTNGMIDKMIEVPLDDMVRLVLFDTVYFKGKWMTPFEAENTHKETFYQNKAQNITEQIDMMNMYGTNLSYIANDVAEGVILPYQNNPEEGLEPYQSVQKKDEKMALIILKSTGDKDIREIYDKLTEETIRDMLVNRRDEVIDLKLPKFEVTYDKVLNQSLIDMGLTMCFDPKKADFHKMGVSKNGRNLYINLVRQKAKIIVDEEGTEAAAVTEIEIKDRCAFVLDEPKQLYFNEPFLYMIMDMDKELLLFIGILDNPKGE